MRPQIRLRERGAVLVMSLVLLTILTLLAVATMRTATLELTIARNSQYVARAFEAAQAGLAIATRRIDAGDLTLVAADAWAHAAAVTGTFGAAGDEYAVGLRYIGPVERAAGDSGGSDALSTPGAHHFEMESMGRAHGATSIQTRGFSVPENNAGPVRPIYWFAHRSGAGI